jgi:hypothetical protein
MVSSEHGGQRTWWAAKSVHSEIGAQSSCAQRVARTIPMRATAAQVALAAQIGQMPGSSELGLGGHEQRALRRDPASVSGTQVQPLRSSTRNGAESNCALMVCELSKSGSLTHARPPARHFFESDMFIRLDRARAR